MSDDDTRPVSVAELLARNGTIGSPPVGGHRRRKRRNAVSVAELTGEIPVIRTGEMPVVVVDEPADVDEPESFGELPAPVTSESVVVYRSTPTSSRHPPRPRRITPITATTRPVTTRPLTTARPRGARP